MAVKVFGLMQGPADGILLSEASAPSERGGALSQQVVRGQGSAAQYGVSSLSSIIYFWMEYGGVGRGPSPERCPRLRAERNSREDRGPHMARCPALTIVCSPFIQGLCVIRCTLRTA